MTPWPPNQKKTVLPESGSQVSAVSSSIFLGRWVGVKKIIIINLSHSVYKINVVS